MPELPEVETIVQELNQSALIGKKILRAEIFWDRIIATPAAAQFLQQIESQTITGVYRQGKYIVFSLSAHTLLIHLRMTGKLLFRAPAHHERARFYLDDGRILSYADQRKFGRFYLVKAADQVLKNVGVDPFSKRFTPEALQSFLNAHSSQIKPFLLNQKYICGLGNIYVDEALWEAQIHPKRLSDTLSDAEIQALYTAILKVLQKGVENLRCSLGQHQANYFSVSGRRGGNQYALNAFRRDGKPCPRCSSTIIKLRVAQRGTHLCPICQR